MTEKDVPAKNTDFYCGKDLTKYNKDVANTYIWQGEVSYHEPVLFYDTCDTDNSFEHTRKRARLLYPIDEVIAVKNVTLDKTFLEGVDFKVEEGELVWLEGGSMPLYTGRLRSLKKADNEIEDPTVAGGNGTYAQYFPTDNEENGYGLNLMFDKLAGFSVYVTYKHKKRWENGANPTPPKRQGDKLTTFYEKLSAEGEDINVLVYGSSTATGASSSGAKMNYELFTAGRDGEPIKLLHSRQEGFGLKAPTFFEQATQKLVDDSKKYHKINYYNIAVGGWHSTLGVKYLQDRIDFLNSYYGKKIIPDIVYIKFMANEVRLAPERYAENMRNIVNILRKNYGNVSVVFVTGKINNTDCITFKDNVDNCLMQEAALVDLAEELGNCVVSRNTTMFYEIVKSKKPVDYLTNNINHAHDYWAMVSAQVIIETMKKPE